jgi:hypothetical protein
LAARRISLTRNAGGRSSGSRLAGTAAEPLEAARALPWRPAAYRRKSGALRHDDFDDFAPEGELFRADAGKAGIGRVSFI